MTAFAITGATGSLGQALARGIAPHASRLVLLSRGELAQADMAMTLDGPNIRYFIGDVRDQSRLEQAFRGVDVVVHAAALKRVDKTARDVQELVRTNVDGTLNVCRAAQAVGAKIVVFTSSDKAVAAENPYGASKKLAEYIIIRANEYSPGRTRLCVTRYGNVLGSRGSVLNLWKAQAARGEPLTVTDPACTRFWLTLSRAVDTILYAASHTMGGEIYIPDLRGTRIGELAALIGPLAPSTGLRPGGEKLHETLMSWPESQRAFYADGYHVIPPELANWTDHRWPEPRSPKGWDYSSHRVAELTPAELKGLLCEPS